MWTAYLRDAVSLLTQMQEDEKLTANLEQAINVTWEALNKGLPVLVCGNGGSASDAQHIVCELVGRFRQERKAANVICLSDNPATLTAVANDYGYEYVFSRQVEAYGTQSGVFLGISTSGKSPNVLKAAEKARSQGMTVIGMTGQGGADLAPLCDILLDVPARITSHVQEGHICLYHYYCLAIEERLLEEKGSHHVLKSVV